MTAVTVYKISLAIGIVLFFLSLFLIKGSIAFIKKGSRAVATVIDNEMDGNNYKAVFKFKTDSNQEITFKDVTASSPPSFDIGEKVTVIYDSNNPNNVETLTYFGAFMWTIILMMFSLPLIVLGGGYFILQGFLK